ncbi:serine hydrolase domain-containing protein [Antarctobacter sp.]|uniref:serine hydrolase domain-containing protein n=1 Tax=Antarctobacter sp. TaxID=1872577 RepID=UPI002B274F15|nr:serine hydrolase domain-containing protein [Antarctobacter sp.]
MPVHHSQSPNDRGPTVSTVARERRLGGDPITEDTVFAIFSTTKSIADATTLQCVEERLLDLDAPAKGYALAIGRLQVIKGFDADGSPRMRDPKTDVTTRQLMLLHRRLWP